MKKGVSLPHPLYKRIPKPANERLKYAPVNPRELLRAYLPLNWSDCLFMKSLAHAELLYFGSYLMQCFFFMFCVVLSRISTKGYSVSVQLIGNRLAHVTLLGTKVA
jgi:hypothetical protein